jgi:transketolase
MPAVETEIKIKLLAEKIRRDVVKMIGCTGQAGHLGGSASSAEIVAALYGHKMRFDPKNPQWEGRDRFIYSKGHAAIAQYAALAETGFFPVAELATTKSLGSRLQGHPDRCKTPGIEAGTGSLGQGLSIANGIALALRLDNSDSRVYCVMGDGEMAEGQIWEAAMAAVVYKLDQLVGFVDRNRLQATGMVAERFPTASLEEKWRGFGWQVITVDGHNVPQILSAIDTAEETKGIPTVVICDTVKGRGISFAENAVGFHNSALTPEQYESALVEIEKRISRLERGER